MALTTQPTTRSRVTAALARDRLGVPSVVFFILSAVAPLTVVAGIVTTAYAVTGLTQVPAAFLVVALVLSLFSVGYVAMARRMSNAGAFYTYAAHGLGRPVGVAAAFVAVLAYNALQVGLLGAFGATAADYATAKFGVTAPWWQWALLAWAIVAVLGLRRVDLNGRVLGVLLSLEVVVLVALTAFGVAKPAGGHLSLGTLDPTRLPGDSFGALLVIAVLGFVGFEASVIFSEESRDPKRTVPVATYTALGVIGLVYAGAGWAMAVHYGSDQVVNVAREQGPEMLFKLGDPWLATTAETLFLTSIFAALLAFHNAVGRYMFALGREQVLPAALGTTSPRTGAPKVASLVQSGLGLGVIFLYAERGWDPLVQLFFYLGTTGGFGVLLLIATTSVAVLGFFGRKRRGEDLWRRILAPGLAALALLAMVWLAVRNYATLLGVEPASPLVWALPGAYGVAAVLGFIWAGWLRARRPAVYRHIGLGANAITGRAVTEAPRPGVAGHAQTWTSGR